MRIWIAIYGLVLCFMWSCSIPSTVHVYNNTNVPLVIRGNDRVYRVNPGTETSFIDRDEDIVVEAEGAARDYNTPVLAPDLRAEYFRGAWNGAHLWFQIESDFRLYVLHSSDSPPIAARNYPQPPGYPVVPTTRDR